ncbi:hypothetical protein QFZ98_004545 [Paraburkholderia youngii]
MPKWRSRDVHGKGAFIMNIATIGLDLAKSVMQFMSFPRFFALQRLRVMRPHPWSSEL